MARPDWRLRGGMAKASLLGMSQFTPTERTKVRRKPDRGSYDRELIYKILDQAFVCHAAVVADGMPFVVPTNYVRVGDKLYLHGSPASRLMKALSSAPFCLSVTLLDGIVFSPTAMGHSVNYRSVVVMGKAEIVEGHAAKLAAMRDFVEYVVRGRWETVRPPTEQEIKATMVLAVPAVEVFVGFSQLQENYGQPGMDVPLMAAAAASAAGSATAGGFGGGTVAIASGGG